MGVPDFCEGGELAVGDQNPRLWINKVCSVRVQEGSGRESRDISASCAESTRTEAFVDMSAPIPRKLPFMSPVEVRTK